MTNTAPIDHDDVKLQNCAVCRRVMLGQSMRHVTLPRKFRDWLWCAGIKNARPYCADCLRGTHERD